MSMPGANESRVMQPCRRDDGTAVDDAHRISNAVSRFI
jgi:hypothetical protein